MFAPVSPFFLSVCGEYPAGYIVQQPIDTHKQVLPSVGAAALNAPVVAVDAVEIESLERGRKIGVG